MHGEKIFLRPILKSDLCKLNQWKNNERIYQFLGGGYRPVSIDQQEKWLDSLIDQTGNNRRFIISELDGNAVGMVGLYSIDWVHRTCEVGIFLGDESCHGKGFAVEAYSLLEQYASEYLNLRKINLKVVSDNEPAISLWSKLGFEAVGVFHKERFIKGSYHDLILMEKFIEKSGGGVL